MNINNVLLEFKTKGIPFAFRRRGLGRASPLSLGNSALNLLEARARRVRLRSNPHLVQIEPTTACNLDCAICGRRTSWQHLQQMRAFMTRDTFLKMVPFLRTAQYAFLHGWGESLLHPDFSWMVRVCKQEGCLVNLTTNGLLLRRDLAAELVDAGLDTVTVSLEGATEQSYQATRGGALETLRSNLEALADAKRRAGTQFPVVEFIFCLMRDNLDELSSLVELASRCDVDAIALSNLIVYNPKLADQTLFGVEDEVRYKIAEAQRAAHREGIGFSYQGLRPSERLPSCPFRAFAVLCDGTVSCCGAQRVILGDIHSQSLRQLWNGPEFQTMRRQYRDGNYPVQCRRCPNFTNARQDYENPDLSYVAETKSKRRWDRTWNPHAVEWSQHSPGMNGRQNDSATYSTTLPAAGSRSTND